MAALAGLLLVWPPPVLAPGVACGPVDGDTAVITAGDLADDGELGTVEQRIVRGDGEVCVTDPDRAVPTVAVAVLHTDAEGRSREAAELGRVEGRLTTRVEARDVTATSREVTVLGPLGATTVERRVGLPQLVRIAVSYPSSWDVTAPEGDGVTTTVVDGVVEVSRSAVLFPPLLEDALALQVQATPARGTPSVTVEASPLAGVEPFVLPAGVLEQDALAVIGALSVLGQDGATQLAEGADELAEGVGELAGGAEELAGGAGELAGGLSGLSRGTGELAGGLSGLWGGAGELAGGLAGLGGGAGELAGGADEVAGGAAELADGTRQLAGGVAESAQGSGQLAAGAGELQQGSVQVAAAAGELAQGAEELAAGAQALADGLAGAGEVPTPELDVDGLTAGLEELAAQIAAVRDDLAALVEPDAGPGDPLVIAVATLTALSDATAGLARELATGLTALGAALEGLEEAAAGAAGLAEGAGELAAGGVALAAGVEELAAGVTELAAGTTELTAGLGQLADATGELSGGASGLATGTAGLAQGSRELADGSQELAAGGRELADGSRELATGGEELAAGTSELATGGAALAAGAGELAGGADELPELLSEVVGVADRSGQDAATTLAVLDAGSELAREHVGAAALRSLQLRHEGEQPVPTAALLGTLGSVLVALLGVFGLLRRRWGRG